MSEHYKALSAVFPVIFQKEDGKRLVLLHQRANTGYMDGMWDFAGSGHVDEHETAKEAVVRECREELAIEVDVKTVSFAHLAHRVGKNGAATYYDIYFFVQDYAGTPVIAEPHKSMGLNWFALDALPTDMICIRRRALENILKRCRYDEFFVG